MKKIEKGRQFLEKNHSLFRCPACGDSYTRVSGNSMICQNGHQIDLNNKGTLNFLKRAVKSEYNQENLESRHEILAKGFFDPFLAIIAQKLREDFKPESRLLDVGSGEGLPLARLAELNPDFNGPWIGFDISKAGIALATQLATEAFFCVADLTQLPFSADGFDIILNLFSPSAYAEFDRILKPNGKIYKIVPHSDYLKELRELLYADQPEKIPYDNQKIVTHFKAHYPHAQEQRINYSFDLTPEDYAALIEMTPLQWGASQEQLAIAKKTPLNKVTVDLTLLIA